MSEIITLTDKHGRTWTIARVRLDQAEAEDARFWCDRLTPEERIEAVAAALESCLKTRGIDAIPRLRRVSRRIKRS